MLAVKDGSRVRVLSFNLNRREDPSLPGRNRVLRWRHAEKVPDHPCGPCLPCGHRLRCGNGLPGDLDPVPSRLTPERSRVLRKDSKQAGRDAREGEYMSAGERFLLPEYPGITFEYREPDANDQRKNPSGL